MEQFIRVEDVWHTTKKCAYMLIKCMGQNIPEKQFSIIVYYSTHELFAVHVFGSFEF